MKENDKNLFRSPLHTICHYSQTVTKLLFRKKKKVLRNVTKRGVHTIRRRTQFLRMCVETKNMTKRVL